ncbi:MAG: RcpC/CpaB family pilus assembly protein [Acidimicrobiia bacterium]|nr:RcpC/CpaB family pilus assembly protein [Acidimicrobiia bacterium]
MAASADEHIQTIGHATPSRGLLSRLSLGHVVMIVAGLLAALLNFTLLQSNEETFPVAVAAADLLPGRVVTSADLRFEEIRATEEVLVTLLQPADVVALEGQVVARTIAAGQLVSPQDFRAPSAPLEQRAISVPVQGDRAVGRAIGIGDRVDVIVVDRDDIAHYVATGLEVLALPGEARQIGGVDFFVTVAVDAETALRVASAIESGEIHIVRSTGSTVPDVELFDPSAMTPDEEVPAEPPVEGGGG